MKLRLALIGVMLALPLLYVTAAHWQKSLGSAGALGFVAVLCFWLLVPERKE